MVIVYSYCHNEKQLDRFLEYVLSKDLECYKAYKIFIDFTLDNPSKFLSILTDCDIELIKVDHLDYPHMVNYSYQNFLMTDDVYKYMIWLDSNCDVCSNSLDNLITAMEENDYYIVSSLTNNDDYPLKLTFDFYYDYDYFLEEDLTIHKTIPTNFLNIKTFAVSKKLCSNLQVYDYIINVNYQEADEILGTIIHKDASRIGVCLNSYSRDLAVISNPKSKSENKPSHILYNTITNTTKQYRKLILCTADRGMGLGDGVMLSNSISELSQHYDIHVIGTDSIYNVLNLYNFSNVKVFNINEQGKFFHNDYYRAYNLIYWDIRNDLRQYPHHALNMVRQYCDLEPYTKTNNTGLLDIPISLSTLTKMTNFIDSLKKPIIVTQPFISFWNKMIDFHKYLKLVDELSTIGTVIQLGTNIPENIISPKGINLINKTSLEESIAILKLSDLFIGCDSFLQHVCAHIKTPAVILWCGTSPEEFGYPFFSNIFHPEIAFCQRKCGRPTR